MRDMPLALAWFLGSIFMLAGVLGGWVLRRAGRRNAASLAERVEVQGHVARYRSEVIDDIGLPGCVIEYAVGGQRYAITAELDPAVYPEGGTIAVMVRAGQPSDGVVRDDIVPRTSWWPVVVFLLGLALVAWGYAGEVRWIGGR